MPTPTIVIVATCVKLTRIVGQVRKLWVNMMLKPKRIRRAKMAPCVCPARRSASATPAVRPGIRTPREPSPASPAIALLAVQNNSCMFALSHGRDQTILIDRFPRELGHGAAVAQHRDAVAPF